MIDLVIVGGGPAGLSAANAAWEAGCRSICIVEREIVAHVTTSEALGAHNRHVARKLIDLNVPELDRVEFDVK